MNDDNTREDALLEAEWTLEHGNVELDSANYQMALNLYSKSIEIFERWGDRHGQGRALGQAATVLLRQDQIEAALRYYREALAIHQETNNKRQEGQLLGHIGIALRRTGDWSAAIEHYQRALVIHQSLNNKRYEGTTLISLGSTYWLLGRHTEAREHYLQALQISRSYGNRRAEGAILNNLGLVAGAVEDGHTAIEHFQDALLIHQQSSDAENEAITLGNIGDSLVSLGRLNEAEGYLRQAIELSQRIDYLLPARVFEGSLAHLLAIRGNTEQALSLIVSSDELLKKYPSEHAKFLCKAAIVYARSGQKETARTSIKHAESLTDSLDAGENSRLKKLLRSAEAAVCG